MGARNMNSQLRQWCKFIVLLWASAVLWVLIALVSNCKKVNISKLTEHDDILKYFVDMLSWLFVNIRGKFELSFFKILTMLGNTVILNNNTMYLF